MTEKLEGEKVEKPKKKGRAVVVRPFHLGAGVVSLVGLIGGGGVYSSNGLGTKLDEHRHELASAFADQKKQLEDQNKQLGELKVALVKFEARDEALDKLNERLAGTVERAVEKVHELERAHVQLSTREADFERRLQALEGGRK